MPCAEPTQGGSTGRSGCHDDVVGRSVRCLAEHRLTCLSLFEVSSNRRLGDKTHVEQFLTVKDIASGLDLLQAGNSDLLFQEA